MAIPFKFGPWWVLWKFVIHNLSMHNFGLCKLISPWIHICEIFLIPSSNPHIIYFFWGLGWFKFGFYCKTKYLLVLCLQYHLTNPRLHHPIKIIWECYDSFPCTFSHLQKCDWIPWHFLGPPPLSCFKLSHESKFRVRTTIITYYEYSHRL